MASHDQSVETSPSESNKCHCNTCKSQRRYRKMHPEQHIMTVKRHYVKHRDEILLSKAYARYLRGNRPQKRTLIKLIDAGFSIKPETIAKYDFRSNENGSFNSIPNVFSVVEAC